MPLIADPIAGEFSGMPVSPLDTDQIVNSVMHVSAEVLWPFETLTDLGQVLEFCIVPKGTVSYFLRPFLSPAAADCTGCRVRSLVSWTIPVPPEMVQDKLVLLGMASGFSVF